MHLTAWSNSFQRVMVFKRPFRPCRWLVSFVFKWRPFPNVTNGQETRTGLKQPWSTGLVINGWPDTHLSMPQMGTRSLEKVELEGKEQRKGGRVSQACSPVSALVMDGQAEIETKQLSSVTPSSRFSLQVFHRSLRQWRMNWCSYNH